MSSGSSDPPDDSAGLTDAERRAAEELHRASVALQLAGARYAEQGIADLQRLADEGGQP